MFRFSALVLREMIRQDGVMTDTAPQTAVPTTKAPGVRARVRAQLTAEIKASARRQLAVEGASSLSLRAIARELDMASSAIYRYFASRDDLLTALIIDAYDSVGTAVEQADVRSDQAEYRQRFIAIASAIRNWAHANPHEYALIYGSPVPGYAAPEDTVDPATRVPVALISVLVDSFAGRSGAGKVDLAPDDGLAASLAQLSEFVDHQVSAPVLAEGVRAWGEIFGLVSLELFGHFNNAVTDPGEFFTHAVASLADRTLAL
jgi:AcrR family transcriptional regulator